MKSLVSADNRFIGYRAFYCPSLMKSYCPTIFEQSVCLFRLSRTRQRGALPKKIYNVFDVCRQPTYSRLRLCTSPRTWSREDVQKHISNVLNTHGLTLRLPYPANPRGTAVAAGTKDDAGVESSKVQRVGLALALAVVGGALFSQMKMPLAWMLGAMFATTLAALAGAKPQMPKSLRFIMQSVVGVLLGSTLTPGTLQQMWHYGTTISGLAMYTSIALLLSYTYLRRVWGYTSATAFFAAAPGGLNDMTIIGGEMGGDDRVIAIAHSLRLLLVVSLLPFLFRLFLSAASSPAQGISARAFVPLGLLDACSLIVCTAVGPFLGKRLQLPAPFLVRADCTHGRVPPCPRTLRSLFPALPTHACTSTSFGGRSVGVANKCLRLD